MNIFEKNNEKFDIYEIREKKEQIKEFKERILEEHKKRQLFYVLMTNRLENALKFNKGKTIDLNDINYSNVTMYEIGDWSKLTPIGKHSYKEEQRDEILEKYINGVYDKLVPTEVIKGRSKYNFIKPENEKIVLRDSENKIYRIENLMDLPEELFLLQNLLSGNFSKVVDADEDISKQLSLFDIEYVKSIKVETLQELIDLGIVDINMMNLLKKISTNSKIIDMTRVRK